MTTKLKTRKLVLNDEQLIELEADPTLATAVILALKEYPDATTRELFMLARASKKQLDLFNQAIAAGDLVIPKDIHDANHNAPKIAEIHDIGKKARATVRAQH
ncbi:hypothetical protein [Microviridae Fen7786_21]|uniref:hypothetical protein n=1 Tax=Microviridae Fen7786_21 TaxID=1655658 RepID=UPI00063D59B5|nr:hypothetical protein [Microviridae Fen7786_21]AKI26934.1 hypothetical protein [Microviridae Fen7786_21]